MAKLKDLFLIRAYEIQCSEAVAEPHITESSSDIASSVSNGAANEFYYDEDFAIPFDANLTDAHHQTAPVEESLLLCSTPGGGSTDHWSADEASLSPYLTVVDLSDSEADVDGSIKENSSASGGGSENYSDTDSRILGGCEILVESDQLIEDMERSREDLSESSDSLAQEVGCGKPEVRLSTWAEVGNGNLKRVDEKTKVYYDSGEMERSNSPALVQYESIRLVTWAGLRNKNCNYAVALEDGLKMSHESSPTLETSFMQNNGSPFALTTGFVSNNVSQESKDTKFLEDSQSPVPLAVGMTTWRMLTASGRHDDSCSCSDDVSSAEEWRSFCEPKYLPSPRREESVSSPSSKDDGYDSVTKDPSICDSQSARGSDAIHPQSNDYQFEGFNGGRDDTKLSSLCRVELPEILKHALAESQLCSSSSTDDGTQRGPCHLSDNSRMAKTLEDLQQSSETEDSLFQCRGLQYEKSTRSTDRQDSLNSSISSSSGEESVVLPVSHFAETETSRSPSEAPTKLSLTHESKTRHVEEETALPKFSKRMGSWNNVVKSEANASIGLYSLLRPLPDLGFLRKSSLKDRYDKQSLRICSETKTEVADSMRKQFVFSSESLRPNLHQDTLERDSDGCSLGKETLSETGNRGDSSQFSPISNRTRSRSSDSSASSGIDPGIADLDDGYGTWSNRKSTLKAQNKLAKTRNSVAIQTSERKRVSKNREESDFKAGGSLDFDKRERLVVKVCNTCNVRTVQLGKEKQTSQRNPPLFWESNTRNLPTLPPKIIVSSANYASPKNAVFDTDDFSENSRHGDIAFDTGYSNENNSAGDITLESISSIENTDIINNALDSVDSSEHYRRDTPQQNVERLSTSENCIQANSWSNLADKPEAKALANYDKSHKEVDSEHIRQQPTNCSGSSTEGQHCEADEQCVSVVSPKTVFAEFSQEKDSGVGQVERHSKTEIKLQLPRANKNVSILENGVLFRPGSGNRGTVSQRNGSKAIRTTSHDQEKLKEDVIGCVWKSETSSDHEESPAEDQPPVDFIISSDTDSSHDSLPSIDTLTKKTGLLLNTMRSVEILMNHFNRNLSSEGLVGSTQSDRQVGHLVLDHLCPALLAILLDGLKPELQGFFGSVHNSVRQVIEDSATLGHPPNLVKNLVTSLKSLKFLNTPWLFFNAFVFALLNCKALDFWLSYVHGHASLLQKHYSSESFLHLSHSTAFRAFQDLVAFLQPLALLPFRLEYNFEVKIQERLLEENRARRALERHLVSADVCLGLVEIQQNFSNDRLLEYSRKSTEERQLLEEAELVSESSDAPQQCASTEANNEVGSNQSPLLKTHIQDITNKVGSNERPPMTSKSSPGVVGVRAIAPVELRAKPHAVYSTPGHENYQRKSEIQSTVCLGKQINCKEQDNQVPRRKAPSAVFTQHSNTTVIAARTLWNDCSQRLGLVKNRLEKLIFG